MNKPVALLLLAGLARASSVAAAGGTLTDQFVSLAYPATHWSADPDADLTGVDATGDPILQAGFWYRAEGDTREFPMPAPDSEVYLNGRLLATWNDLDGKGFEVRKATYLVDGEGPSGGFYSSVTVENNNAVAGQFTLFHYLDADLAGSAGGDTGALVTSRFLKFSDGSSRVAYRAFGSSHYQVSAFPGLRTLLNNTATTTLSDAGLPFAAGNATAAFQFGPETIAAGSVLGLAKVSVFVNPARDHVKGDFLGLGLTALVGQPSDLGNRYFQWMRRTSQDLSALFVGGPGPVVSVAGVDDFYGDLADELVTRDLTTGVAYVGTVAIGGAPVLPLNWKLSATGDFDADGKADILWRNTSSQKLVIWTMNGHTKIGNITPSPDQAANANWEVAAAADFNGDGLRDLLWYNQTSGNLVIWFMDAAVVRITGQFTNPGSVGNNNWRALAVGDYGKGAGGFHDTQDIVWQNDTSKKLVTWHMDLAGNRTSGTFTTPDLLNGGWDLAGPR